MLRSSPLNRSTGIIVGVGGRGSITSASDRNNCNRSQHVPAGQDGERRLYGFWRARQTCVTTCVVRSARRETVRLGHPCPCGRDRWLIFGGFNRCACGMYCWVVRWPHTRIVSRTKKPITDTRFRIEDGAEPAGGLSGLAHGDRMSGVKGARSQRATTVPSTVRAQELVSAPGQGRPKVAHLLGRRRSPLP